MFKEKRGTSHLGFVLSFVIFLTFLLFMYAMIEPVLKIQPGKETLLNEIKDGVIEKLRIESGEVTTMTITMAGSRTHNCVKITGGDIYNKADGGTPLKIKDDANNLVEYKFQGSQLLIGISQSYVGGLKIYYGTNIDSSPEYTGPAGCDQVTTSTKITKTNSGLIESKITDLKNSYETDYAALKTNLAVPTGSDFTFTFSSPDNSTSISPENVDIPDTNIYVSSFPIDYFDSDANLKLGILKVTVW